MRYFYDTEFSESGPGHPIRPISIGIVREDGATFYAEYRFDWDKCVNLWLHQNVKPHLLNHQHSRIDIAQLILDFVGNDKPEWWGYYCMDPETRVLTDDLNWMLAGDLQVGTGLIAFDRDNPVGRGRSCSWRKWRPSSVEAVQMIEMPCYALRFDDGTIVQASADHRWLVNNGDGARWITTSGLRADPCYSSNVVKPLDYWARQSTYAAGYLAAALDGEGFLSQREHPTLNGSICRIGFSQRENVMLEKVESLLMERGFTPTRKQHPTSGVFTLMIGKRSEVIRLLGEVRPSRLMQQFNSSHLGAMKLRTVKLVKKVDVGLKQVVAPKTTTGTIIAEGLASHNSDYDHVVLCQTFGRMIDLPGEWPKYTMDIKQQCKMLGNPTLPDKTGQEHNALDDARWNKKAWEFLDSLKGSHHTEP